MLYLHNILNGVWMIEASTAFNYLPLIGSWLQGKPLSLPRTNRKNSLRIASLRSGMFEFSENDIDVTPESVSDNSVALVNITGAITKYDQECGPDGMISLSDILNRCYDNDKIKGIILVVDSGGGEGMACRLLQDTVVRRNKPVIGFISDMAASAAYGILSPCDLIVANNTMARTGSIGSYITIADYQQYYANLGVKLIDIYATKSKDKNQEFIQAIMGNQEPLRKICDAYNEDFISRIAAFRLGKISPDPSLWATGKTFFASEALDLGLIDRIDSLKNVIHYLNI